MTEPKDSYHDATVELGSNKPASSAEHIEASGIHDGDMVITDMKGSDGDFKLSFGMIMALLVSETTPPQQVQPPTDAMSLVFPTGLLF